MARLRNPNGLTNEFKDALGCPGCFLEVAPEPGQRGDRTSDGHGIQEEGNESPGSERAS